jgi:hypothetical protein
MEREGGFFAHYFAFYTLKRNLALRLLIIPLPAQATKRQEEKI